MASAGRFTVLEIAPERNGCAAAIIFTWPMWLIARSPTATSNTGMCSSDSAGAPTIVACSPMCASICWTCSGG